MVHSGSISEEGFDRAAGCALQIPPLRSPNFLSKPDGLEGLHAALLKESRTRGRLWQREVGNSGRDDKGESGASGGE